MMLRARGLREHSVQRPLVAVLTPWPRWTTSQRSATMHTQIRFNGTTFRKEVCMAGVFISYSRQDRDFVLRLQQTLVAAGRAVWVDLKDIPPTSEWQREIDAGIAAAETFIAVLSPDYLASAACAKEVERAVEFKKRMVPLVCRDVHAAGAPPALAALNWTFCRPSDDFAAA